MGSYRTVATWTDPGSESTRNSWLLTAGSGISFSWDASLPSPALVITNTSGGGPGSSGTSFLPTSALSITASAGNALLDLSATAVTPGSSYNSLTVDSRGRITAAETIAVSSSTSYVLTSALSVTVAGQAVTIDLPALVTTGSYNSLTVDKYGRVTAAAMVSSSGPPYSFTSLSATTGYAALALHDSEMSFTLSSGKLYRFKANYVFMTAATTTGLRMGLTCPAFSVLAATGRVPVAAGGTAELYSSAITGSGVSVTGTGVALAGVNYLGQIEGMIQPSAGGALVFQWASEINASRVTIAAGSCAELWQLTP